MKTNNDWGQGCGCEDGSEGVALGAIAGSELDASRTLFRVGASSTATGSTISELLQALPFLKTKPVIGTYTAGSPIAVDMFVQVQWVESVPAAQFYTINTSAVVDVTATLGGTQQFKLGRIGGRVRVLTIDAAATMPGTVQDFAALQAQAAAISVLRKLDETLTRGDVALGEFSGAAQIVSSLDTQGITRYAVSAGSGTLPAELRAMMAQITPNGPTGSGAAIDCFFGGPKALRKLMSLAPGAEGASGWRRDARTGRNVYHYQGIPYYRTNALEAETGSIWAANLGPDGLSVVHAFGTGTSFGITMQETPVTSATGTRELTVQGAWALVLWDPGALFELRSVDLASL